MIIAWFSDNCTCIHVWHAWPIKKEQTCITHINWFSLHAAHVVTVSLSSSKRTLSTGLSGDRADRFNPTWQYLSVEATRTLVSYLDLSRLDYCNAPLPGSPQVLLDKIQRAISCPARLIYKAKKSAHITPLLFDLHWLPTSSWIQYKIALTCFHIVSGSAPPYLSELLHLYSPSSFRSASDTRISRVPGVCRRTLGERFFQYIGPVIWNSLPFSVRHA